MTAGDFPRGKEFDCPDCLLVNGHPDAVPQINFCAYCKRKSVPVYTKHVDPVNGGCWFCHTDDMGEWWFSKEFDCYAHEKCIRQCANEGDKEALIMVKEFEMD